jgi:ribonuclease HI
MVMDYGASLGRGTNNYAELYGLGVIFTRLVSLHRAHPRVKRAVVFCDSKLALRAAVSIKRPISNGPITRAVRAAFLTASRVMEIDLQWIRGHALYGGNERVDRISKTFASIANNNFMHTVDDSFPASVVTRVWEHGFPLIGLPVGVFIQNLPEPPPVLTILALDPSTVPSCSVSVNVARSLTDPNTSLVNYRPFRVL